MGNNYRLDRSQFSKLSFEDADREINDYKKNTPQERLENANRLIAIAYNFSFNNPPKMDKNYFKARSLNNGKHI
jgi:hypothetical protein